MQLLPQFAQLRMNVKQAVVGRGARFVDSFHLAICMAVFKSGIIFYVALVVHVMVFVGAWRRHFRVNAPLDAGEFGLGKALGNGQYAGRQEPTLGEDHASILERQ